MSKKSKIAAAVAAVATPDVTPTVEAPANQPEPLYVWVGTKRDLTGRGPPRADGQNRGTAEKFAELSAQNGGKGHPLGAYRAIAAQRGHKGFARYALKAGWLALPTPTEEVTA